VRLRGLVVLSILVAWSGLVGYGACGTALLVIDVQELFLDRHPWVTSEGEAVVDAIVRALALARSANIPVIYIQDFSTPNWEEFFADELGFPAAIAPHEGDAVIEKTAPSAFRDAALADLLGALGVEHLLFTGIASDGCVEATLFAAIALGYEVTVIADVHASWKAAASASIRMNSYWRSLGVSVIPLADVDWASLGCDPEGD